MNTIKLSNSNKSVSKIIMGTMIIGLANYDESAKLLDDAMKNGINAFDLALVYGGGDSERALGKWMQERGNREDVYIITKGAHPGDGRQRVTPKDIDEDLMESLSRLKSDYIDAYLLHRDDESQAVGPIMDTLHKHQAAGRIRAFGGSNWTHQRIAEANAYATSKNQSLMTLSSPNYGLCEQVNDPWGPGCVTISGATGADARSFYKDNDIPVMAYSSLGRGMLSGRVTRENYKDILDGAALTAYAHEVNFIRLERATEMAEQKGVTVPQIALAYILSQQFCVLPIVGTASLKEIEEATAACEIILSEEELKRLEG
jgi:aryl-alcohol dehydrogenase-like predicted oxidoreductase